MSGANLPHRFQGLMCAVMVSLMSILVVGCGTTTGVTNTPNTEFPYQVRVIDATSDRYISRAKVTLEVQGQTPLDEFSDNNGLARIIVGASYVGKPGRLIVEVSGYEKYIQNIDITKDLPTEIALQPLPVAVGSTESPTNTSVTLQPTELPTNTPSPSQEATPTPTPTPTTATTPTTTPEQNLLNVGESFEENGLKITLASAKVNESGVFLSFVIQNTSQNTKLLRYRNNSFQVSESGGRILNQYQAYIDTLKQCPLEPGSSLTINSGGPISLNTFFAACDGISFYPDVVSEQATSLIITLTQFMGLEDIKWQIDL